MKGTLKDTEYLIDNEGMTFHQLSLAFEKSFDDFEKTRKSEKYGIQLDGFKKFNLTKRSALHILAYTGFSAKWINSYLRQQRSKNPTESAELFIKNFDNALLSLPHFRMLHLKIYTIHQRC